LKWSYDRAEQVAKRTVGIGENMIEIEWHLSWKALTGLKELRIFDEG
jgi:hypothetical protein